MALDDAIAWTYQADIYCPVCIVDLVATDYPESQDVDLSNAFDTEDKLFKLAGHLKIDYTDEYSYDSDDFPKPVFQMNSEEVWEDHCGHCHERIIE